MDLDLGQMQDLFDAAAADGAEPDSAAPKPAEEKPLPEINSGLDAMKLAATDPKEWMRAREDYDKKVAEDMILEGGGELTREDAFKYLGVLIVSFVCATRASLARSAAVLMVAACAGTPPMRASTISFCRS